MVAGIILGNVMKIDGSLIRNIDFEVTNFDNHEKIRGKISILKLRNMKI